MQAIEITYGFLFSPDFFRGSYQFWYNLVTSVCRIVKIKHSLILAGTSIKTNNQRMKKWSRNFNGNHYA